MDYARALQKHRKKYGPMVPWRYAWLTVADLEIDAGYAASAERNVARLAEDIDKNGIRWPICVHYRDRKIHVVVGSHRVLAARLLGLFMIEAVVYDINGTYSAPLIDDPLLLFGDGARLDRYKGEITPNDGYFAHAA